ncbi:GNAT family N-acetyltransferase [Streptococcus caprae]|uniref:GNAT family N-acetyltransferase n=1 Tax=Streptococcus caprae TaxID=1640501 RepID=A0ABV8CVK5_9STRE
MKHLGTVLIETERLRLRPLTLSDTQAMYDNWANDVDVSRYVTWETHANSEETAELMAFWCQQYDQPNFYNWGIEIKETGELIGTFTFVSLSERDLVAELGYCIGQQWWNKGYVTEAGKALLDFGFQQLGLNRIEAIHDVRNPASGRVMEKLGMSYEGTMRQIRKVKGQFVTVKPYSILAKENH